MPRVPDSPSQCKDSGQDKPSKLFEACLQRFDELRAENKLFFEESETEKYDDGEFQFQFRLVEIFAKKPLPAQDEAPEAEDSDAKPDPFGHPDPAYVVGSTERHLLQLNMFNALRPQLILHPKEYAPQTDLLTLDDFAAALEILHLLGPTPHVVFYNCCPESGSSQPYKHLQLVPKPEEDKFVLFPDNSSSAKTASSDIMVADVPHLCFLSYMQQGVSADDLYKAYKEMVNRMPRHETHPLLPHNVIFTPKWICAVPRRAAVSGEPLCFANSMGMMGVVWVASEEERQGWGVHGYSKYLVELGYPSKGIDAN